VTSSAASSRRAASVPRWYAGALLALGALAALAVVGAPAGLALAFVGVALCAAGAVAAPRRDAWTLATWALAAALAAIPGVRAAGWIVWMDVVAAGLLASLAAAGGRSGRQVALGLLALVRRLPFAVPAAVVPLRGADATRLRPALRGGALAAILLAVFVPLFASADDAFAEILDRAVPADLPVDQPVVRAFALLAVLAVGGGLALAARHGGTRAAREPEQRLARLDWLLPLSALVALFALFVGVQLTTLFAGHDHVLRTAGLTYAEYAHRGFGELIAAAVLTLAVVAAAWRWARRERLLRALLAALCALCLVVLASAFKRLGLYEEAFGFTRLRLMADAHIMWLAAVLLATAAAVVSGRARWLPRGIVALSAAGALAFALSNPDGRIARENAARGDVDLAYLAGLSADAAPALARLGGDAPCAVWRIRADLERPDGLAGANLARSRARGAVARVHGVAMDCPEWPDWS
jgi:Domain of unknown function (DUF4173)